MIADAIRLLLFPALMAFAASSDLLTMTISNRLSTLLAAAFFVLTVMTGMSLAAVGMHMAAGGLVLAVAFIFFWRGWVGGGDAKLAAVTTMWFGFEYLLDYLVYAAFLGGVLTVMLLLLRRLPLPGVLQRQSWIQRLHEPGGGVPYGIALAAAAMLIYPHTHWMPAGT
jgi:prepilin peptidase CpaA